ncbi:MAG: hypothetical protein ACOX81_07085 [Candidatus Heteroscillospira sp.]|jgi:hypothetical protein
MFDLFRKKRINQYLRGVGLHIGYTYIPPAKPMDDQPGIRYSISDEDSGVSYSLKETPKSNHHPHGIPGQGDSYQVSTVSQLLSQHSASKEELKKELDNTLDLSFVDMLIRYINIKGWRDSKVYKAAHMDRRLFSKIMSDREYKPSKDTALSLVIGLELNLEQTTDMLSRAGYTLSHSNKRDVIIEYFVREGIYNITDINDVLFQLGQKVIGR